MLLLLISTSLLYAALFGEGEMREGRVNLFDYRSWCGRRSISFGFISVGHQCCLGQIGEANGSVVDNRAGLYTGNFYGAGSSAGVSVEEDECHRDGVAVDCAVTGGDYSDLLDESDVGGAPCEGF